jgi:hypothetical protein
MAILAVKCHPGNPSGPAEPQEVRRILSRQQQTKLHQRLFYVGLADAMTLEAATDKAFADISRQLIWLPLESRELLRGMYRIDRQLLDRRGRIHVLAVLERQAAAAHLQQVAREKRGLLRNLLSSCQQHENAGDIKQARSCLDHALVQVKAVQLLLAASRAAVGDLAQAEPFNEESQANKLSDRFNGIIARGHSVWVHVIREEDGKKIGYLDVEFSKEIVKHDFKLVSGRMVDDQIDLALAGHTKDLSAQGQAAGAGYLIVGKVSAQFSSELSGQYFAWANGQIKVIETTAGHTIAEFSYDKIKGGHLTREQACEKAVMNAVSQLREDLGAKFSLLK